MHRLLSTEEIRSALQSKFAEKALKYPDHFAGLIPEASSEASVCSTSEKIANLIDSALPKSFVTGMRKWNLGRLELSGIAFGRTGDFAAQIERYNEPVPGVQWWEDREQDERPPNLLMIGQGDPHVILLEQSTGQILAYVADEGSPSCTLVAPNLSIFLRGLGSVYLHLHNRGEHAETLADDLIAQIGPEVDKAFWHELANTYADV